MQTDRDLLDTVSYFKTVAVPLSICIEGERKGPSNENRMSIKLARCAAPANKSKGCRYIMRL